MLVLRAGGPMPGRNGSVKNHVATEHHFDEENDSLRASVKHLFDRVMTKPAEPTRFGTFVTRTEELIKAHPFAAIGIAAGIGYAIIRIARR
jgi:ElaB/YqjD/DUF883 family membrane-anchored ribosome-binding protein